MVDLVKRHEWPLPREPDPEPVQDAIVQMGRVDPYGGADLTFWGLSSGTPGGVRVPDGWIWRYDNGG